MDQLHLKLLNFAIDHTVSRISALQKPPPYDFAVLNYGKEKVRCQVQNFAPVLTEMEVDAIPMQWMNHLFPLRTSESNLIYS